MRSLLRFDLVGPMAHFRKFYTNSSSLSYPFPPRTTLVGVLAAVLGWERDTYYEQFHLERASVGVRLLHPVRTLMQTVNYLNTKEERMFDGSGKGTQVPVEWVLPPAGQRLLTYRVYVTHVEPSILEQLYERMHNQCYTYPLYFGLSECPAWMEGARFYGPEDFRLLEAPSQPIPICTVIPVEQIVEFRVRQGIRVLRDRVPLDFDPDRKPSRIATVIWEASGQPIEVTVRGLIYEVEQERGVFLQ